MATATFAVVDPDTANTDTYPVLTFTPAVDDLIVVFAKFAASVEPGAVFDATDDQSGTYVKILTALFDTSAHSLVCLVREQLVTSAVGHIITVTCIGDASTGNISAVYRVAGMSRTGSSAVRQSAKQNNTAAGTPAPAFPAAALTGNVTLGAVADTTNPTAITPPTSWTEGQDSGHATPAHGMESVFRNSGFTGTTITWGSATAAAFASMIVELDTSTVFTVALAGAIAPTATLTRRTRKLLAGPMAPTGAMTRKTFKLLAGPVAPTGTLTRKTTKPLTGQVAPTAGLTRRTLKFLAGPVSPSGALTRKTFKLLAGPIAPTGMLTKRTRKAAFSGAVAPSAALANRLIRTIALAGAISPTGTLVRKTFHRGLAGAVSPTGTLTRRARKRLAGQIGAPPGWGSAPWGSSGWGGEWGALFLKRKRFVSLAGQVAPTGTLARFVRKALAGAIAPSGAIAKRARKHGLAGEIAPTALLTRRVRKLLAGQIAPSGTLQTLLLKLGNFGYAVSSIITAIARSRSRRRDTAEGSDQEG